jgi:hypothetical protein
MRKVITLSLAMLIVAGGIVHGQSEARRQDEADYAKKVDTRVDNNRYWRKLAEQGLVKLNPVIPVEQARYVGSEIRSLTSITEDSPDVPVAPFSTTQSENSVFVHPNDNQLVINSNNSTPNPVSGLYGANALKTEDGGENWGGIVQGAGGSNSGDPVALIGLNGTYFIGSISGSGGQSIARSTNNGVSYTVHNVANAAGGGLLDKNHMWIDNSPVSPYSGHLYNAWTDFGGFANYQIALSRSTDDGITWSAPVNVSSAVNAGSHCQGVNISTGPNGEVYVIWSIYDGWPTDETAIGMARSFDGGATWEPATRIITNTRGIRNTSIGKNMRKNSFPSMAVDISGGDMNGNIYIVWSNVGVPGINTGQDVDVYLVRSGDLGNTWTAPIRVNQDPSGLGRKHYFPWLTCDPENGILSVVFYDDRNVGGNQCEVFCANSFDGGETWEDFKVSDVSFTPGPIPGLAEGYMGDYLGIAARGGWVYPSWADNRTGTVMTYISPYQTNPLARPKFLTASVEFETGISDLHWQFDPEPGFSYFKIYRGNDSIGMTTDTLFYDQLPDYGIYNYKVTAVFEGIGESSPTMAGVQWGDARISVEPESIYHVLRPDSSAVRYLTIHNVGQLEMNYSFSMFIPNDPVDDSRAYCSATGGCDEYISRVILNDIDNSSGCTQYGNYTDLITYMSVGNTYQITVINGNPIYSQDKCGLWIDWNQNEVFDADESITMSGSPGVGPYTANITPPPEAKPGPTRLRTRIVYYGSPQPCGSSTYGEVEDYTVHVLSWINSDPMAGSVNPGESVQIAITLSAAELEPATYTAELTINSNDPDIPEIMVPVTLVVSEIGITFPGVEENICLGDSIELTTAISGGSGEYTYSWSSDPEGFISGEPSPLVAPDTTTNYFLEVSDGFITVENFITIFVNPLPEVYLGADTVICEGETVVLSAGEGYAAYKWNTGETGISIEVTEQATYWVKVTNEYGCHATDSLHLAVTQVPEMPVIIEGPVSADNYFNAPSYYTCEEVPFAEYYTWSVIPPEAGESVSTGTTGEFTWATGFTGTVEITVIAGNDCFTGEPSEVFTTEVYSSAGIEDITADNRILVYPNPGNGQFSIRLPEATAFKGSLSVIDAAGVPVYGSQNIQITGGNHYQLNIHHLPDGMYTLKLESRDKTFLGRILLKH